MRELFTHEPRTLIYFVVVVGVQIALAVFASRSWATAIAMGIIVGPFLDAMVLVLMHELSHNRCTGVVLYDRLISIAANTVMLFPISEIFRQHHNSHHIMLGDYHDDVDVPCRWEVEFVGNSTWKKAIWLTFNMVFLPIRSLHKLEVKWNKYVVLNWVVCLSAFAAVLLVSPKAWAFLFLSLLFSQGAHPANARQLQRHFWQGDEAMAINAHGGAAHTFSYYGWSNFFFLNVGFHNEHHDFSQVPWTKLPQLRAMVGDKWYPDTAAYKSRGIFDVYSFIFDPKCSLANFYSAERAPARVAQFKKDGAAAEPAAATSTAPAAAASVPATTRVGAAAMLAADEIVPAPVKEAAKATSKAGRAARRPDLSVAGDDTAIVAAASSRSDGESGSDSGSDVAPAVPSPVVCEPVSEAEPVPLPEEAGSEGGADDAHAAAAPAPSARRRVARKQA